MKTLGIDLGSNSLGWAIISENEFIDQGVVIFDEGINREKGKDSIETPAAIRRAKRMGRRLKLRRRYRKLRVLKLLIEHGMCPLTPAELAQLREKGIVPDNPQYREWLKSVPSDVEGHCNPYYARAMAADHMVDPMLAGRAIYHLAQRRGFKSSRKDLKEEGSAREKELGIVKSDIARISEELQKRNCTLGQYFYELNQKGVKVRKHHLGRVEHYQTEFNQIADVQHFSPELRDALFHELFSQRPLRPQSFLAGNCPLETSRPRCLLGHPLFEEFRMYSFLNTIKLDDGSGFRLLTHEEREKLIPGFYKKARSIKFSDLTKLILPKSSKKNAGPQIEFNYSKEKSVSTCMVSHSLNSVLGMPCLLWKHEVSINDKSVTYDFQTIFDALVFFDDDAKLQAFACNKLGLSQEQAIALSKIIVPEGTAQYSLCAIRKILPFLKMGYDLSLSVFMAKLPDLLGKALFFANQDRILNDIKNLSDDYRLDKEKSSKNIKLLSLSSRLNAYLEDTWHLTPDKLALLYHRTDSAYEKVTDENGILPPVNLGMLRNPLVQRSMTILRRLVNELRREGKIDQETQINIELARSVNDRNTRMAWETWQKNREAERLEAVAALAPYTDSPSDDLIERYLLAREQPDNACIYTGKPITIEALLRGNSFDIEHTVPRSRSGDNSRANKTICDNAFNRDIKKGCLPVELPNYEEIQVRLRPWYEKCKNLEDLKAAQKRIAELIPADEPERKAAARQKMLVTSFELKYWKKKLHYFEITADNLDEGFMNRQLVDTGIMTRHAVDFLRSVYPRTYPVNGVATAWARKAWGIQDTDEKKERIDHTHHAVDAMVIAALDREKFRQICTAFRDNGTAAYTPLDKTAFYAGFLPFTGFRTKLREAVEKILVKSYVRHNELKQTFSRCTYLAKAVKKADGTIQKKVSSAGDTIRGQLHAETFYGKITDPADHVQKYVVRKFINDQTTFPNAAAFDKIVDHAVAKTVREQVQAYIQQGKTFKEAVNLPIWMKVPDAEGKGGVPILKVRICTNIADPHKLKPQLTPSSIEYKNFYYVNSGKDSNFRVALYLRSKRSKGQDVQVREVHVDNLLDCAQSRKQEDFIPWEQRTDLGQFLGFLYPGRMVLIYENSPDELKTMTPEQLKQRLYIFSKIEGGGRMTLRYHREARSAKELKELYKTGSSKLNFSVPEKLLFVSPSIYLGHTLFEGIDFSISMTGKITFL